MKQDWRMKVEIADAYVKYKIEVIEISFHFELMLGKHPGENNVLKKNWVILGERKTD